MISKQQYINKIRKKKEEVLPEQCLNCVYCILKIDNKILYDVKTDTLNAVCIKDHCEVWEGV